MNWTEADLKKKLQAGKITSFKINSKKSAINNPKVEPKTVTAIREDLRAIEDVLGYKVEEEYRFHPTRKWRFDFVIKDLRIGIEYEGLNSEKSRHTTLKGYSGDATKYNEAQRLGWVVLRYTALTYKNVAIDIRNIIHGKITNNQ